MKSLLSNEQVQAMRTPIETALTFPGSAYTDREFFDWEVEKIFHNHWVAVAFENQLADAGAVFPVELCGASLLLTRDQNRKIHALFNVCPYDGGQLATESKTDQDCLRSNYHGWVYALDGNFVKAPFWNGRDDGSDPDFGDFDPNLRTVSCESFEGIVFINLDKKPQPFSDYIKPLQTAYLDYTGELEYQRDQNGEASIITFPLAVNWKLIAENYLNEQHTHHVHRDYIDSPEKPAVDADGKALWQDHIDGDLFANRLAYRHFIKTYGDWSHKPGIARDNSQPGPAYASFTILYPNLYVCVEGATIVLGFLLPDGPESTRITQTMVGHREFINNPEYRSEVEVVAEGYALAGREDAIPLKSVQKNKHSPALEQYFYSPFWDQLHYRWNKHILDALLTSG
jgi:phenylpropionate dioxygenase-like ring-hydroxylating dioxygenase large terminal subunit